MTNERSNTLAYASYGLWSLGEGGDGYMVVREIAVEVENSITNVEISTDQTIYIEVNVDKVINVEIEE